MYASISSPSKENSSPSVEEQKRFDSEEVKELIKTIVESTVKEKPYDHNEVPEWSNAISKGCLKELQDKNRNIKYVVTCTIMQKNGAGFYSGSMVSWDSTHDVSANYRHENRSLYVIVNVFCLSV